MYALTLTLLLTVPGADSAGADKGTARFEPVGDQKNIPERYRLDPHKFDWEMKHKHDLPASGVEVYDVRFPSPVKTDCEPNNTVYCQYFRPKGKDPFPAVVVLDITAGDQTVSRMISTHLASHGIAALFMQMPYYGPRRPAGSKERMITADYSRSMDNVRQAVLDVRQSTAWLESRPEVDAKRIGIVGTSLGSFIGTLAAEMEPRLNRVVALLGGGGLVDAYYDDPRGRAYRKIWEALGGTKEKLEKLIAPADPLTCAANLKDHKVLMINGKRDEVVFPKMAEALWKAAGEPKIVWYDCTHVGAALYFLDAMDHIVKHLGED
jgi:dienelactone hydrolase